MNFNNQLICFLISSLLIMISIKVGAQTLDKMEITEGYYIGDAYFDNNSIKSIRPITGGGSKLWVFKTLKNELVITKCDWTTRASKVREQHKSFIYKKKSWVELNRKFDYTCPLEDDYCYLKGELNDGTIVNIKTIHKPEETVASEEFKKLISSYGLILNLR